MRRLHLAVGILSLVAFVLTGQYMDKVHAHLEVMADAPRLLYRSAHIYLLFAGLLNLLLGGYVVWARDAYIRPMQQASSVALLAVPALFLVAFFQEPWLTGLERPWARPGIYLSLGAVIIHTLAARSVPRLATDP